MKNNAPIANRVVDMTEKMRERRSQRGPTPAQMKEVPIIVSQGYGMVNHPGLGKKGLYIPARFVMRPTAESEIPPVYPVPGARKK